MPFFCLPYQKNIFFSISPYTHFVLLILKFYQTPIKYSNFLKIEYFFTKKKKNDIVEHRG